MSDELFSFEDFEETRRPGFMECGHHENDTTHYETCLKLTCPICGITEETGYLLWSGHDPHRNDHVHSCSLTQASFDHAACCIKCLGYTFGHEGSCIWKHCELYTVPHAVDHAAREAIPCSVHDCPATNERRVFRINAW